MTYSQSNHIINLYTAGSNFLTITEITGVNRKVISRILAEAGVDTRGNTFALLYDPSGIFDGDSNIFDCGNMCASLWLNSWVPGMVFLERRTGGEYVVEPWMWVYESRNRREERQLLRGEREILRPVNVHSLKREKIDG